MATTETSGGLRAQAAAAESETSAHVHDSLSEERGGVMAPEETARLKRHSQRLLAVVDELRQSEEEGLESLSFGDLRPSNTDDEAVKVPRLDDD